MSGHSKWASIRHKKGALDSKRGKIFSKIVKEITAHARRGGGSLEQNPGLRLVVQKAKDVNMPQDNILRAIKKGTGELPGVKIEEIVYEGYGPGGVAVLVETLSDNRNRTTGEVRNAFDKHKGNMAGQGAVAWQFVSKGYVSVSKKTVEEDKLMNLVIDLGALDFKAEGDTYEVTTDPKDFETVRRGIEDAGIPIETGEITKLPTSVVKVQGSDAKAVLGLVEALEDLDDVQHVYANFDMPDEDLQ